MAPDISYEDSYEDEEEEDMSSAESSRESARYSMVDSLVDVAHLTGTYNSQISHCVSAIRLIISAEPVRVGRSVMSACHQGCT